MGMTAFMRNFIIGELVRAWEPRDAKGLILWLKADKGTFTTSGGTTPANVVNDPVGRWEDQSGLGNHVVQATSGRRPLLTGAIQAGKPEISFDGVDDALAKIGGFTQLASVNGWTLAIVLNPTITSLDQAVIGTGEGGSNCAFAMFFNGTPLHYTIVGSIGNDGGYNYTGSGAQLTVWTFDGTQSVATDRLRARRNGAAQGLLFDGTMPTVIGAAVQNLIIGREANTDNYPAHMDLAEIVVYNRALTTPERGALENYLNARWLLY